MKNNAHALRAFSLVLIEIVQQLYKGCSDRNYEPRNQYQRKPEEHERPHSLESARSQTCPGSDADQRKYQPGVIQNDHRKWANISSEIFEQPSIRG